MFERNFPRKTLTNSCVFFLLNFASVLKRFAASILPCLMILLPKKTNTAEEQNGYQSRGNDVHIISFKH
jgi:hypothetical protein